jgi:4-diphosphocytidyl-2-C-methyl-D-erythritol kinase
MTSLTRPAYAKINLTLDVGARRPDGYHDISSVMQTVSLHDTLTVTRTADAPGVRLEVTGDEGAGIPADESNLVHRAAVRLQKVAAARGDIPGNRSGLHILLHKRIPSQAGLGGGSSDAAATLLAVNDLLELALSHSRLTEIGAALGADVPFFLTGGTAWVEGLGERVTALPPLLPPWFLVVIKPHVGVSTAAAYAALDALPGRVPGTATDGWLRGGQRMANDFESVILPGYPEIAAACVLLHQTEQTDESFRPLLCGSGSCLFRRVSTQEEGERLAGEVKATQLGRAWVTMTQGADE